MESLAQSKITAKYYNFLNSRFWKIAKTISFFYPLTFTGSVFLAAALYLMGRAFTGHNPYGWILSTIMIFLLACLVIIGRIQAFRAGRLHVEWDYTVPVFAGRQNQHQELRVDEISIFPFFRLHFILKGKMRIGRKSYIYIYQDSSSHGAGGVSVPLYFPLCGTLDGRGSLAVKDIFGFTFNRFGETMKRSISVKPGLLPEEDTFPVHALDGLEDNSKKKESDIERYFMREYIPGDRFRDINWKASSRFSELFTRIAPVTQEKTHVISVILRPYRRNTLETVQSLSHLNYIKSKLLHFIKGVKQAYPDYQFRVFLGREQKMVKTQEDIEHLGSDLCSIFFQLPMPVGAEGSDSDASGNLFIFTTPYDETLSAFLSAQPRTDVNVFTTAFPKRRQGTQRRSRMKEMVLFRLASTLSIPGRWIFKRTPNPEKFYSGTGKGIRVMRDILNIKVFGAGSNLEQEETQENP